MTRPRLAQLHRSGATSGQSPVWNNTAGEWEPGTPAGGAPSGSAGGDLAGTYPNPTIGSAGMEAIRDMLATVIAPGTGITVTVNDGADTITVASTVTAYTDEQVRDVMGVALVAGTGISIAVNDAGDTLTITSTVGTTAGGLTTAFAPLTTTVAGVPDLVWDASDNLVLTEVPIP